MRVTAEDILMDREKRVEIQKELMDRYGRTLVFIRVNYPGVNKENSLTKNIIQVLDKLISQMFIDNTIFKMVRTTAEGPNITLILEEDPKKVKETVIQIEDKHPLGRCIDIDVYDPKTGLSLSRTEMGISPRKCFVCDDIAANCVRSRKHDLKEVIDFIEGCYSNYKEIFNVY